MPAQAHTKDKLVRLANNTWRFMRSDNALETYDANGRLISIAEHTGRTLSLSYDGSARLSQVSDPFQRALTFAYDAGNRITSVTGPDGLAIQYGLCR